MKSYLIMLLVATTFTALSQNRKYEKASVVTLEGDTITGLVHVKNKVSLCNEVKFIRDDSGDEIIRYKPFDIVSFCLEDKDISYQSLDYKNNKTPATGFGELIFSDEIRLFKFYLEPYKVNEISYLKDHSYVLETDTASYTLQQTVSVLKEKEAAFYTGQKFVNTKSHNQLRKEYIGTLCCAFADQPELFRMISKTSFNDQEIIRVIKRYIKDKRH